VARYYWRDNRPSLEDLLKRAIVLRGKPEILYCDLCRPRDYADLPSCGERAA